MKRFLKSILPDNLVCGIQRFREHYIFGYKRNSYSQAGEDMILAQLFNEKMNGFYIDVGAYHPRKYSNTYLFYRRGWCGINIDASPGSMLLFQRERSRDINIEAAVSDKNIKTTFLCYNEPAYNALKSDTKISNPPPANLIETVDLSTVRLDQLIHEHLPAGQAIDFLDIDVEGNELAVLQSNDWSSFRPRVILVEALKQNMTDVQNSELHRFLTTHEYSLWYKTNYTLFYISREFINDNLHLYKNHDG